MLASSARSRLFQFSEQAKLFIKHEQIGIVRWGISMKFKVMGADRDTGDDIEMIVEANSRDEAFAKANRRGVLVTDCAPATGHPTNSGAHRRGPVTTHSGGRRVLRLLSVLTVTLVVTVAVIWLVWLRPQNEQIDRTLNEAVKQSELSGQRAQQNTAKELNDLRRRAAEHGVALSGSSSGVSPDAGAAERASKREAIDRYLASAQPFMREIKALRSRVAAGSNYNEYNQQLLAMADAFAQLEAPPPEAVAFAESANDAVDLYQRAGRQWMLAIRNNLWVAEKQRITEMLERADGQVESTESNFNQLRSQAK